VHRCATEELSFPLAPDHPLQCDGFVLGVPDFCRSLVGRLENHISPWKINGWNLRIPALEKGKTSSKLHFQVSMFIFGGCFVHDEIPVVLLPGILWIFCVFVLFPELTYSQRNH